MSKYNSLNDRQYEAVTTTEGPLLILAGAGSGKTRVLTHRIAYLIEEKNVKPWNIMAITFTNKAAKEMRERVNKIVGEGADDIWVSTFHSSCVKILRRFIDRLGYEKSFTIYDTDDQKSIMKDILKTYNIDTKQMPEKAVLSEISRAKDKLIGYEQYKIEAVGDFRKETIAKLYVEYQKRLMASNALDFDDLIMKTTELFIMAKDVLDYYQDKFKYIMVDEYQDTNIAQYKLISLLASKHKNLCVVGDDDQSIYKFRGANIENILGFENDFADAKVIKLEENYRSTKKILESANVVIANNFGRKAKTLWTSNDDGEDIIFNKLDNNYAEAEYISSEIRKLGQEAGFSHKEIAILYRTNAQSRSLEEKLIMLGVPYKIIGGTNFYSRREIKDILSYLKTIDNAKDDLACKRIINVPKRGIGLASIDKIDELALYNDTSFFDALKEADQSPQTARIAVKLQGFVRLIQTYRTKIEFMKISDLVNELLDEIGYVKELKAENTDESKGRLENIDELLNKIIYFEETAEDKSLSAFLQDVALVAEIDNLDQAADYVSLMTLHSAKGLEYPVVFLAGVEDGVFPSYMSLNSEDPSDIEEERRLCYVGITRAMQRLYITCARERMMHGQTAYNKPSRFIEEMPQNLINDVSAVRARHTSAFIEKPVKKSEPQIKMETYGQMKKADVIIDYVVGDVVKHIKFGTGKVTEIIPKGVDYEITIDFEGAGTKKLLASFAKLKKI
ncbi:MAG: pcrA 2 [Clostridiales bacterium]|jgi:DNA helicase-2/ATP-dependent DNA helicase PcrA|nr:pcrA 2 [Clostridiales bacterium]